MDRSRVGGHPLLGFHGLHGDAAGGSEGGSCRFLGSECRLLTPGKKGQVALRYTNPAADWTQYKKVMVFPVAFFGDETTKVSALDQQALTDYFHQVILEERGKKFQIPEQLLLQRGVSLITTKEG